MKHKVYNKCGFAMSTIAINTFDVQYSLSMKSTAYSKIKVNNIDLNVRKNVISPDMTIIILGVIIFIVSVIGFILIGKK